MEPTGPSALALRIELFVDDMAVSLDFYRRVLGFQPGESQADGYTPMGHGPVRIALNRRAALPADHPVQASAPERMGRGVELVLEVADLEAVYARVVAEQWPLSGPLQRQPWGLRDFRLVDPDGYYWRITDSGL
jgi:lactoylglutathione lyase